MNINEQKKLIKEVTTGKIKHLNMSDRFQFECNGCGKCCFNNDTILNIYDVIRLRHGLKQPTQEIFKKDYLNFYLGPSSGLPIVALNFKKLNDSGTLTCCPFLIPALDFSDVMVRLKKLAGNDEKKLKEMIEQYKVSPQSFKKDLEGIKVKKWLCSVYNDRPIICRLYPCGRFQEVNQKTKEVKERFILQDTEKEKKLCPGFQSKKITTLADYLTAQNFYHSKEGSAIFTEIMNWLILSGFFASTPDNKNRLEKPLFQNNSAIMVFIGNLLYNFDSFNVFSKDPRTIKTIYDKDATQKDFIYVENKVFDVLKGFINTMKNQNPTEIDFQQFINSLTKGGV